MAIIGPLLFFLATCLPGLALAFAGWRLTKNMQAAWAQVALRALLISVATTPARGGDGAIVAAVWVALFSHGDFAVTPLLIVWAAAALLLGARVACRRKQPESGNPR